jgi:hypothetical protein
MLTDDDVPGFLHKRRLHPVSVRYLAPPNRQVAGLLEGAYDEFDVTTGVLDDQGAASALLARTADVPDGCDWLSRLDMRPGFLC